MNHDWQKLPDEEIYSGVMGTAAVCRICGCKKSMGKHKYASPIYSRSGQVYTAYRECVDLAAEDLKTID